MTVKEYLGQARYLNLFLEAKLAQIEELKVQASKADIILNDVNGKGDTLECFNQLEEETRCEIDHLLNLKKEIRDTINRVDDDECRLILEKRFLQGQKYCEIAKDMYMSEKSIYRIQDKAFKKIVEIKNGSCP